MAMSKTGQDYSPALPYGALIADCHFQPIEKTDVDAQK